MIRNDLERVLDHMPAGSNKIEHHRSGQTLAFTDRSECYAMLGAMAAEGVNVPGYVFTRLYDEMANEGDIVGIKKSPKPPKGMSPF
jgi:hypothetical protein